MKAAPEARRAGTQSQRRGGLGSRGGMRRKETTEDEGRAVFSSARVAFFKKGLHLKKKCDILKSAERNARRHIAPYAPLAQMDRAQASDAWCRRFESAMVRQTKRSAPRQVVLFRIMVLIRTVRKKSAGFLCRRGAKQKTSDYQSKSPLRRSSVLIRHGARWTAKRYA